MLSQDAEKILFRYPDGNLHTHILATGKAPGVLDGILAGAGPMGWSADGSRVAYACPSMPADICVADLKLAEARNTTKNLPNNSSGSFTGYTFAGWNEDGDRMGILFYREPAPAEVQTFYVGTIEVMDTKTSGVQRVFSEENNPEIEHIRDAALSPDGSKFLFAAKKGGRYAIFQVNSDGSGLARVTPESLDFDILHPIWSPDGSSFLASAPELGHPSDSSVHLPTLFDLSGNIVGQMTIPGGGEAVTWVEKPNASKASFSTSPTLSQTEFPKTVLGMASTEKGLTAVLTKINLEPQNPAAEICAELPSAADWLAYFSARLDDKIVNITGISVINADTAHTEAKRCYQVSFDPHAFEVESAPAKLVLSLDSLKILLPEKIPSDSEILAAAKAEAQKRGLDFEFQNVNHGGNILITKKPENMSEDQAALIVAGILQSQAGQVDGPWVFTIDLNP